MEKAQGSDTRAGRGSVRDLAPFPTSRQLVLIPSYNTGTKVLATVREARQFWRTVWVIVDGSTDGTGAALQALADGDPGLKVFVLPHNRGKGAAV